MLCKFVRPLRTPACTASNRFWCVSSPGGTRRSGRDSRTTTLYHTRLSEPLAQCMGLPPRSCQASLGECREEYDTCPDTAKLHRVAHLFCGPGAIRGEIDADLLVDPDIVPHVDFPNLFLTLQEHAFISIGETTAEAQHSFTAHALAPTGYLMPATVSVPIRQREMHNLMADEAFREYVRRHWRDQIWKPLLQPLLGPKKLPARGSARMGFTYGFSVGEQCNNLQPQAKANTMWGAQGISAIPKRSRYPSRLKLACCWIC